MIRRLAVVAGTRWNNIDGSSRIDVARQVTPGMSLELVREPGNAHDEYAIAVLAFGKQIGFVPADMSEAFSTLLDAGLNVRARAISVGIDAYDAPAVSMELLYDPKWEHEAAR